MVAYLDAPQVLSCEAAPKGILQVNRKQHKEFQEYG
jgi:hypothetical protein